MIERWRENLPQEAVDPPLRSIGLFIISICLESRFGTSFARPMACRTIPVVREVSSVQFAHSFGHRDQIPLRFARVRLPNRMRQYVILCLAVVNTTYRVHRLATVATQCLLATVATQCALATVATQCALATVVAKMKRNAVQLTFFLREKERRFASP